MDPSDFLTADRAQELHGRDQTEPNGWLLFASCDGGAEFAEAVRRVYVERSENVDVPILGAPDASITRRFPDTETCFRLPISVAGADAYVFQSAHSHLYDRSVNENIQELLQAVRTLKAHRARSITVVLPYSPYGRQERPTFMQREASLAKLFADQLRIAGADAFLTYHPHTYALYGFCEPAVRFVPLDGLHLFTELFAEWRNDEDAIAVSTDAGGAKAVVRFAGIIGIDYAIANKFRSSSTKTETLGVIGKVEGKKKAVILDDEVVTGGSLIGCARRIVEDYGIEEVHAAVSHFKSPPEALERFAEAREAGWLKRLHVTDTVPHVSEVDALDHIKVHSIVDRIAAAINRLHFSCSVSVLFDS
jgi:ribose-phosphate pyrophosphokinase